MTSARGDSNGCLQGLGHDMKHEAYLMYITINTTSHFNSRPETQSKEEANDYIKKGNKTHTNTFNFISNAKIYSLWRSLIFYNWL